MNLEQLLGKNMSSYNEFSKSEYVVIVRLQKHISRDGAQTFPNLISQWSGDIMESIEGQRYLCIL